MTTEVKYIYTSSTARDILDFHTETDGYTLVGREYALTGNSSVNIVKSALGVSVSALSLLGGEDVIFFDGLWSDYTKDTTSISGAIIFTRTVGGQTETVIVGNGAIALTQDKLVFADGAVRTDTARSALTANIAATITDLAAATNTTWDANTTTGNPGSTLPASFNATIKGVAVSAAGVTFATPAVGVAHTLVGAGGVDKIYVTAGATVNAISLLGGEDIIYLTGSWADYTKDITSVSGAIVFTRTVDGNVEKVTVGNGAIALTQDKVVFADGAVRTDTIRKTLTNVGLGATVANLVTEGQATAATTADDWDAATTTPLAGPPSVKAVSIAGADGAGMAKTTALTTGDKIVVTLETSTAVDVTGTPTFAIDVGGQARTASYVSGSGTKLLVFEYTVAVGDADGAGGITALADGLALNGGTIQTAQSLALTLATPAVAAGANTIAVDTSFVRSSMLLASHDSTASGLVAGIDGATYAGASADGKIVYFTAAGAAAFGFTDGNAGGTDLFARNLATGAITLVNSTSSTLNTSVGSTVTWLGASADGLRVAFSVTDAGAFGFTASSGADVLVKNLTTGAVTLANATAAAPTVATGTNLAFRAISADGTTVLYSATDAASLGMTDGTGTGTDLFAKNLSTGAIVLVNATAAAGTTSAGAGATYAGLSPDGKTVFFTVTNADALGFSDGNGTQADLLAKNLDTGALTLLNGLAVSPSAGSSLTYRALSADKSTLYFTANDATQFGFTDVNGTGTADLYAVNTATGAVTLVNATAAAATTAVGGNINFVAASPDGQTVFFYTDQPERFGFANAYVQSWNLLAKNLATGAVTLVSTTSGLTHAVGNGITYRGLSADGVKLYFTTTSAHAFGFVDSNGGGNDLIVRDQATGALTLVNALSTDPSASLGNNVNYAGSSSNGNVVFFTTTSADSFGFTDTANGGGTDILAKNLTTGAITLVTGTAAAAGVALGASVTFRGASTDGSAAAFSVTNADAFGVTDGNTTGTDLFVKNVTTGVLTLVNATQAAATTSAGTNVAFQAISGDGARVVFSASNADGFAFTDGNASGTDLFVKNLGTGALTLVNALSTNATHAMGVAVTYRGMSSDGNTVLFSATNADTFGFTNSNGAGVDLFAKNVTSGALTLVNATQAAPNTAVGTSLNPLGVTADGNTVFFSTTTANAFGFSEGNGGSTDIVAKNLSTGAVTLVNSTTADTGATRGTSVGWQGVAADGSVVVFSNNDGTQFGMTDGNGAGTTDLYAKKLSDGTLTLVNATGAAPTASAGAGTAFRGISSTGTWVYFTATDAAGFGFTDGNTTGVDLFAKNLATGQLVLVNSDATTQTASLGASVTFQGASLDGNTVFFTVTNAASFGAVDANGGGVDLFAKNLTTGAVTLISSPQVAASLTQANGFANLSGDGSTIFITHLDSAGWGYTDGNGTGALDIVAKRLTGAGAGTSVLVNATQADPNTTVGTSVTWRGASTDGTWIFFTATNADGFGFTNTNAAGVDLFAKNISTGELKLLSSTAAAPTDAVGASVTYVGATSNGAYVFFSATDAASFGMTETNGTGADLYRKDVATGALTLVNAASTAATTSVGNGVTFLSASSDGNLVFFTSSSAAAFGYTDANTTGVDLFVKNLSTGAVTLVNGVTGAVGAVGTSLTYRAMSADGARLLFTTTTADAFGYDDTANGAGGDVLALDVATGATTLVNATQAAPAKALGSSVTYTGMSGDGAYVYFTATDAASFGLTEGNGASTDLFAKKLADGALTLVNSTQATPGTGVGTTVAYRGASADGNWVYFTNNDATQFGLVDSNGAGTADLYAKNLATGALRLVNATALAPNTGAGTAVTFLNASSDGNTVFFSATNADAFGLPDGNGGSTDLFAKDMTTGAIAALNTVNIRPAVGNSVTFRALSADKSTLFFTANNADVFGYVDGNGSGTADLFAVTLASGAVRLVNSTAAAPNTGAGGTVTYQGTSANGNIVLFTNNDGTQFGVTDGNGTGAADLYAKNLTTGALTLVNATQADATTTAGTTVVSRGVSADGAWVYFTNNDATQFGLTDGSGAGTADLYAKNLATGALQLVNATAAAATTAAGSGATFLGASSDGATVFFSVTNADALGVPDGNGGSADLFAKNLTTGAVTLLSGANATPAVGTSVTFRGVSTNGTQLYFTATDADKFGFTDNTGANADLFATNLSNGTVRLVNATAAAPNTAVGSNLTYAGSSADGNLVFFTATDAASFGMTDNTGAGTDLFVKNLSTGALTLLNAASAAATTAVGTGVVYRGASADGAWVYFTASDANAFGFTNTNGTKADLIAKNTATGAVKLVNATAAAASDAVGTGVTFRGASADGNLAIFSATDAASLGFTDGNSIGADLFVKNLTSNALTLVNATQAAATTTAGSTVNYIGASADGAWVYFTNSNATEFGLTDVNGAGTADLYAKNTTSGALVLVNSMASATGTAVGAGVTFRGASPDGATVFFSTTNADAFGFTDGNAGGVDVIAKNLTTGAITLVNSTNIEAAAGTGVTYRGLSSDGSTLYFTSNDANLHGFTDGNGTGAADLYAKNLATGAITLVNSTAAAPNTALGTTVTFVGAGSNGQTVFFTVTDAIGGTDTNWIEVSLYMKNIATGALTVINTTSLPLSGGWAPTLNGLSSDGNRAVFTMVTSAPFGFTDVNGTGANDIVVRNLSAGTYQLVNATAAAPSNSVGGSVTFRGMSPDGNTIVFSATDAATFGFTDVNGGSMDLFAKNLTTGALTLLTATAAAPTVSVGTSVTYQGISGDGSVVYFTNNDATQFGITTDTSGAGAPDLYAKNIATGALTLVNAAAADPGNALGTAVTFRGASSTGGIVLFSVTNADAFGFTNTNTTGVDLLAKNLGTGAVTLVNSTAAASNDAVGTTVTYQGMSTNGNVVVFTNNDGTQFGMTDSNGTTTADLYAKNLTTGALTLLNATTGAPTTAIGTTLTFRAMSGDGDRVYFTATNADAFGFTNTNAASIDLFAKTVSSGTLTLVNATAAAATTAVGTTVTYAGRSGDGNVVYFTNQDATQFGGTNTNTTNVDLYAKNLTSAALTLVNATSAAATTAVGTGVTFRGSSSDGAWVYFTSNDATLLGMTTDANGTGAGDLFAKNIGTGQLVLVNATAAAQTDAVGSGVTFLNASADGNTVFFSITDATALGYSDNNYSNAANLFAKNLTTGAVTAVTGVTGTDPTVGLTVTYRGLSSDGSKLVFTAGNADAFGFTDANTSNQDIFVRDQATGTLALVNALSTAPNATVNTGIGYAGMSADANLIFFTGAASAFGLADGNSTQTDLIVKNMATGALSVINTSSINAAVGSSVTWRAASADGTRAVFSATNADAFGFTDTANTTGVDLFAVNASTGTITLVNATAAAATTALGSSVTFQGISSDGAQVVFSATNADAFGFTDTANTTGVDLFVKNVSTGALSLVNATSAAATTAIGTSVTYRGMSTDGNRVIFSVTNADAFGLTNTNAASVDLLVKNVSTGAVTLVNATAGALTSAVGTTVTYQGRSDNGNLVIFTNNAAAELGMTDSNGAGTDLYAKNVSTGALTLINATSAAATTAIGTSATFRGVSSDGNRVYFTVTNADAFGLTNTNAASVDLLAKNVSTGAITLVNATAAAATTSVGTTVAYVGASSDGNVVYFTNSNATELGLTDVNGTGTADLYAKNLTSGALTLVNSTAAAGTTAVGTTVTFRGASSDGNLVFFTATGAEAFDVPDNNGAGVDLYAKNLTTGALTLLSSNSSSAYALGTAITFRGVSADNNVVVFSGNDATKFGFTDVNNTGTQDLYARNLSTGAVTLLNAVSAAPRSALGTSLTYRDISADGNLVYFTATNADAFGFTNTNAASADLLAKNLTTGALTLVNATAAAATTSVGTTVTWVGGSGDGNVVYFTNQDATQFGLTDGNGATTVDLYAKDLTSGALTLVNSTVAGTTAVGAAVTFRGASGNGNLVFFSATNADGFGFSDGNSTGTDLFMKNLTTGAVTLLNQSPLGNSGGAALAVQGVSGNGGTLFFTSTDAAAFGFTDGNTTGADLYAKNLTSGAVTLVNATAAAPNNSAGTGVTFRGASSDGNRVFFTATNADGFGFTNVNGGGVDLFAKNVSTGALTLVNTTAAQPTHAVGASVAYQGASASGNIVYFSNNNAVELGLTDVNGTGTADLYAKDLTSGALTLVNALAGDPSARGNAVTFRGRSDDGNLVFFTATNADAFGFGDGNGGSLDLFAKNLTTGDLTLVNSVDGGTSSADPFATFRGASADGNIVVFWAGNATAYGFIDANGTGTGDYLAKNLTTGALTLINATAAAPNTAIGTSLTHQAISADGNRVYFTITNADAFGFTNTNAASVDLLAKNVSSGAVTLVNATAADATTAVGTTVTFRGISGDGNLVYFTNADAVQFGGTNTNGTGLDLYAKDLTTGALTLVNATAAAATAAVGTGVTWSGSSNDGNWVYFTSNDATLLGATSDVNGAGAADLFAKNLTTGAVVLVNSATAGVTAGTTVTFIGASADGNTVFFRATNADAFGFVDGNGATTDIFAKNLTTGVLTLLNDTGVRPAVGNSVTWLDMTADGARAYFSATNADAFGFTDTANTTGTDLIAKNTGTGAYTLVNATAAAPTVSVGASVTWRGKSGDGNTVFFTATNADGFGYTNTNGAAADLFAKNVSTGALTLVNSTAAAPGNAVGASVGYIGASSDGNVVVFTNNAAAELGMTDGNGAAADYYAKNLTTGALTLLNATAAAPTTTVGASLTHRGITADGAWVFFTVTNADSFGYTNTNGGSADLIAKNTSTGAIVLVNSATAAPATSNAALGATVGFVGSSTDGNVVFFTNNNATEYGQLDGNGTGTADLYAKNLTTGALTLVSTHSTAPAQGNGVTWLGLSSDDSTAFFSTTNADAFGYTDINGGGVDIIARNLATGALTLVNALPGTPNATSAAATYLGTSPDGATVFFSTTDAQSYGYPNVGGTAVFAKNLTSGALTLLNSTASPGAATGNGLTYRGISADNNLVYFTVNNADAFGFTDGNQINVGDLLAKNLTTNALTLVNSTTGTTTTSVGSNVTFVGASSNGNVVIFTNNDATQFGMTDGNGTGVADLYAKNLTSGALTLINATQAAATAAAGTATYRGMSSNGAWVYFTNADATQFGLTDNNGASLDLFAKNVSTGQLVLVNSTEAAPGVALGATVGSVLWLGVGGVAGASPDGNLVAFAVNNAEAWGFGNVNATGNDILVKNLTTGAVTLVNRNVAGDAVGNSVSFQGFSTDGNTVFFTTTNADAFGFVDGNGANTDLLAYNMSTGAHTLLTGYSGQTAVGNSVTYQALSADGSKLFFTTTNADAFSGLWDGNGGGVDLLVRDLGTGQVSLVSSTQGAPELAVGNNITYVGASSDGNKVLFATTSADAFGFTDANGGNYELLVKNLTTGAVTLVSAVPSAPNVTVGALNTFNATISADGNTVFFPVTNASAFGFVEANGSSIDYLAKNLTTGALTLLTGSTLTPAVGNSLTFRGLTDDAGKVIFTATNADVFGYTDTANTTGADLFVRTIATNALTLVNATAAAPTVAVGNSVAYQGVSGNGNLVYFTATNADGFGFTDTANTTGADLFAKNLTSGALTLVSASGGAPTAATGNSVTFRGASSDGNVVLFTATNADGFGFTDGNTTGVDLFAKNLSTGALTLINSTSNAPAVSAGNSVAYVGMSADGKKVFFYAANADAFGFTDGNGTGTTDLYAKDLTTGALTLVSAAATAPNTAVGAGVAFYGVSADGNTVFFSATNADAFGFSNANGGAVDLFARNLTTGAVTLLNGVSANPTAGNALGFQALSADQNTLVMTVTNADAFGFTEGNGGTTDIVVKNMTTGAYTLVNATAAAPTTSAGNGVTYRGLSGNAGTVYFTATNADGFGMTDGNTTGADLFAKNLATGALTLVNATAAAATTSAGSSVGFAGASGDGNVVYFTNADATQFGMTDGNTTGTDLYAKNLTTGALTLVNAVPATATASLGNGVTFRGASADGNLVLFTAGNADAFGFTDTANTTATDLFVKNLAAGAVTLVNSTAAAPTEAVGNSVTYLNLSSDGGTVFFQVTNADAFGFTDFNGAGVDFLAKNLATGAVTLLNRPSAATPLAVGNSVTFRGLSVDGNSLFFTATNADVFGFTEGNTTQTDLFARNLTTGAITLVNATADAAGTTAGNGVTYAGASANGNVVFFTASNADGFGLTDGNTTGADLLAKNLTTGALTLVNATAAAATTSAGTSVAFLSASSDGNTVFFSSTTAAAFGFADGNTGSTDVLAKNLTTGALTLLNQTTLQPSAGTSLTYKDLSADGGTLLFTVTNADGFGFSDGNGGGVDILAKNLATGAYTLVNATQAAPSSSAGTSAAYAGLSADGNTVFFSATNADGFGLTNTNGAAVDLFAKNLTTGALTLVNSTAAAPADAVGAGAAYVGSSPDGKTAYFSATNADAFGFTDGNAGGTDLFAKNLATGALTLINTLPASPTASAGNDVTFRGVSPDGKLLFFTATNAEAFGFTDGNGAGVDLFAKDVSTGAFMLVNASAANAQASGAAGVNFKGLSADNNWVYFSASDVTGYGNPGSVFTNAGTPAEQVVAARLNVLDLLDGFDNGSSKYDNVTSLTSFNLDALVKPSEQVKLMDGATEVGAATADAQGRATFSLTGVAVGEHRYTVTDANGATYAAAGAAGSSALFGETLTVTVIPA